MYTHTYLLLACKNNTAEKAAKSIMVNQQGGITGGLLISICHSLGLSTEFAKKTRLQLATLRLGAFK